MFLQTIPKRNDNELTRLVYEAQKKEPLRRDFIKLIEENAQLIIYVIDEEKIRNISKYEHPKEIKQKIRTAAFKHLQTLQVSQSKLKNIKFYTLKLQEYRCAPNMSKDDMALLFAFRTRTVFGIINDFGDMYQSDK